MAVRRWISGAAPITQVSTITVANTWATADTGTITCNGKNLILTVGAITTTAGIAEALVAAINAAGKADDLVGTESRNIGGQEIPEFRDFVASLSGSTVILTGVTPGVPFTVTVAETTAGSGTLAIAATVVPTGPNHVDNADNYSGATLPASGDTLQADDGAEPMLYGLTYFRANTIDFHFLRTTDYTGDVGLPPVNEGGYPEYRTRFLQLYDGSGAKDVTFLTGANGGAGGVTRLDGASQEINSLTVIDAGNPDPAQANVEFAGGTIQTLIVRRGYVLIDPEQASMAGTTIDASVIGAPSMQDSETLVVFGDAVVFDAGSTHTVNSGQVTVNAALANGTPITVNITGGLVEAKGGNLDTVNVKGGTLAWDGSGTNSGQTIAVWTGATLDLSRDSRSKTFGTLNAYGGSTIHLGTYSPTITYIGCTQFQVNRTDYTDAA